MWNDSTSTLYYQVGIGTGNGKTLGDHDIWRLLQADDTYGGSGWAVRLRYWTLAAKDTQRGPTWSVRCSDPEGRRSEHRQANAPTADSMVAATPSRQARAYAASRVY